MKPRFTVTILVAALLLFISFCPRLYAETITVGDYTQPTDLPLVRSGDEILAPVLLGLSRIGVSYVCVGKKLGLKTPAGKEINLVIGEKTGDVNGEPLQLAAAPVFIKQRCYLPLHSLADELGLIVILDEPNKRLLLLPKLTQLKFEEREDTLSVTLGAQVPLKTAEGRLVDPPRFFVDIENLFLDAKREKEIKKGVLLKLRTGARGEDAAGVRVVLDLSRDAPAATHLSEDGCRLTITLPKDPGEMEARPVVLKDISLQAADERAAALTLSLSAPALGESEMRLEEKRLFVRIFNCSNSLEKLPQVPDHSIIAALELRQLGAAGEVQELEIRLRRGAKHLLLPDGNKVQILIGDFSVSDLKVVIDPGHGGSMTGAFGRSGLKEKEINLDIALKLEKLLKDAGATVWMTRRIDCELRDIPMTRRGPDKEAWRAELCMRPALANQEKADIFVSIHNNANDPGNPHPKTGSEVYYFPTPKGKILASTILQNLVESIKRNDGGIHSNEKFWVLKQAQMPAVLVEVAYITDKEEEKLLATEDFRAKAAQGIFFGIKQYAEVGVSKGISSDSDDGAAPAVAPAGDGEEPGPSAGDESEAAPPTETDTTATQG